MRKLFNQFDVDGSGEITVENLREAFTRLGRASEVEQDEQIFKMIKLHDENDDGKISFDEFMNILQSGEDSISVGSGRPAAFSLTAI